MPHTATTQSKFIDECLDLAKSTFSGCTRNNTFNYSPEMEMEFVNFAQLLLRKVHELYRSDEYAYTDLMSCHLKVKMPLYYSGASEYCPQARALRRTKSFTDSNATEYETD